MSDNRKRSPRRDKGPKLSPLHTPKALNAAKREVIGELGKDVDGAYRYWNRKATG